MLPGSVFPIFLFVVFGLPASAGGLFLMFKTPGAPSQFGPQPQTKSIASAALTVLRKSFDFKGRASRSEFWWYCVFAITVINPLIGLVMIKNQTVGEWLALPCLIPGLAVGTRRLHDIGRSGWWQVLGLTGVGILILLVLWVLPARPHNDAEVADVFE